jgi:hypothetical protein
VTGGDALEVGVGDFVRVVPLLLADTVGATLDARRLVGVGVEGGGERFIGEADLAGGVDDEEKVSGRFEVDAEMRLGRALGGVKVGETFDGEGFAGEGGEDGIIRDGVVGRLDAAADAGVVELNRLRAVMVPVSVLLAAEVTPVS